MNEQYVSFEVAKLLKEKGFNGYCHVIHINNHNSLIGKVINNSELITTHEYKFCKDQENCITIPTQQMACQWLREVHKIDISVTPDDGSWWIKITELESWSSVFNGKVLNSNDIKYAYKGDTSTKEGCYEAGLWYVLKNLI